MRLAYQPSFEGGKIDGAITNAEDKRVSSGSYVDQTVLLHPRVGHPIVRHPRIRLPVHFLRLRSLFPSFPCVLSLFDGSSDFVRVRGRETEEGLLCWSGEDRPKGQSSSAQHVVAMQEKNRHACLIKGALDNGPPLLIMGLQVKVQCVISAICIFLCNSFFICPFYFCFSVFDKLIF